jgi:hypothetical protein
MADLDGGTINSRAAAYVEKQHREQRQALFDQHRMQEQRELARRKAELHSFKHQHSAVEERYAARTQQIERGRERARQAIERRHDSLAGRLQRITPAGRARQRDEFERLTTRAEQLHARAYNQYSNSCERLMHNEQKARIGHARELKALHQQHWQYREEHAQRHQQSREQQIESRTQTLRQVAEQQLRQAMKHDRQQTQTHHR